MNEPITVNYMPDGDSFHITVTDGVHTDTGTAAGLIAARELADKLVAKMAGDDSPTVVHLLDGDAFEFTTQYLHARLGLDLPGAPSQPQAPAAKGTAEGTAEPAAEAPAEASGPSDTASDAVSNAEPPTIEQPAIAESIPAQQSAPAKDAAPTESAAADDGEADQSSDRAGQSPEVPEQAGEGLASGHLLAAADSVFKTS